VDIDGSPESKFINRPFTPSKLRTIVNKWQTFMLDNGGWNALYMENHDQGRAISRYASDDPKYRSLSSKMIATHLLFQCGTPFIFQGQESAMANVPKGWQVDNYKDIELINHWASVLRDHPDDLDLQKRTLEQYRLISRDNARTPMQWNSAPFAGFMPKDSKARPWMNLHQDFECWNVEAQLHNSSSALNYWRASLAHRKEKKAVFVYGDFKMLDQENENVITYLRSAADERSRALISTNFANKDVLWHVPVEAKSIVQDGTVILNNYHETPSLDKAGTIRLRPFEALVWFME
jgi:glycosidase